MMRYQQLLALFVFLFTMHTSYAGGIPEIPQIPAFLPTVDSVAATKPMPIDGTWLITSIGKKVRIESGRAYAVDGWVHLFTLKIQPGMVVIKNINPKTAGTYEGDDLPLLGKWTATIQANRNLSVSVAGTLGPVKYTMVPVQIDKPDSFRNEMIQAGLVAGETPPPDEPSPPVTHPDSEEDEEEEDDEEEHEMPPGSSEDDEGEEDEGEDNFDFEDEGEDSEGDAASDGERVEASDHGPYACRGKNLYYSKVKGKKGCYSCPDGYSRYSPTRKMNHKKACTLRQKGKNKYAKAQYEHAYSRNCKSGQYKHKGHCWSCPAGYRKETAPTVNLDAYPTGYCVPK